MASNIPVRYLSLFFLFYLSISNKSHRGQTRRALRTARTTVLKDENANANPRSRIVTRSKPPSTSNHTTQPSIPSRLTAPTVSTRTKAVTKDSQLEDPAAQGKRKRSTLADVTVNKPKTRGLAAEKGKAKEDATQAVPVPPSKFAGVVIKNKAAATTAIPQSRQVLRSVTAAAPHLAPPSRRTTRSSAAPNHVVTGAKVELKATLHVDAMEIDPPDLHVPPTRVNGHARKLTSSVTAAQKTSAGHVNHTERGRDEMEAEANRVFKKRRTSSEAPEDQKEDGKEHVEAGDQVRDIAERELQKHLQDIGREVEADPNGPDWEDLDAEDADDPMMVSEYVTEIFDYLKIVEVRFSNFTELTFTNHEFSYSKQPSLTRTIWTARRTWHGKCVESSQTG
jgi:hypothetical protein